MAEILCVSPYCAVRGQHSSICEDPDGCRGCQPRRAADGMYLCQRCAQNLAEDPGRLAELHDALGEVLIGGGGSGEHVSGSSTGAPIPNPEVMAARDDIRTTLLALARLIMAERGFQPPTIRHGKRSYVDSTVPTLAKYVARSADWLAAHPAADEHAKDLRDLATDGRIRGMAYPSRTDRIYIGQCPIETDDGPCEERLHQAHGQPAISCPRCGTTGTIDQWQQWIVGDTAATADAYAIAATLSSRWDRPVDPGLLSDWARRGRIPKATRPAPTAANPDAVEVLRDAKQRTLYPLDPVLEYATKIWGEPTSGKIRPAVPCG